MPTLVNAPSPARAFGGAGFFACICIALAVLGEVWIGGIAVVVIPIAFAVAMLLSTLRLMHLFAREAALTSEGLSARTYSGRTVSVPWSNVHSVAILHVRTFGSSERARITFERGAPLLIPDLIPGWGSVLTALRVYVPEQKWTKDSGRWWERLTEAG